MMLEWLEWLEGTGLGRIARESLYGFQVLVAIHILGLIFSIGTLLWVDPDSAVITSSESGFALNE